MTTYYILIAARATREELRKGAEPDYEFLSQSESLELTKRFQMTLYEMGYSLDSLIIKPLDHKANIRELNEIVDICNRLWTTISRHI